MNATMNGWILFNLFVIAMLALDIGVVHRKAHEIQIREALVWSGFWILLALLFNLGIYWRAGKIAALQFMTGYLLEKSLSVDNIFVFILIFAYFKIPSMYQHQVLFWGILGAIVMRALFIICGVAVIYRFHWVVYILGVILIYSGLRLFSGEEKEVRPESNLIVKWFHRIIPTTQEMKKEKFFIREKGKFLATPLFVTLFVIEVTDVVFAMDSIPAILAITHDPFIVYTSNIFAILGLRALYFAVAGIMKLFYYLHYGLGAILVFVGIKMLISHWYQIPVGTALIVIFGILLVSILSSLFLGKRHDSSQ